jgi:putative endonuclease
MNTFYVYIMANKSRSTLYIGITNNLTKRILEHRSESNPGFTSRYHCNRLIYFEQFEKPSDAIHREKQLKGWRREKKEALILTKNPDVEDLAITVLGLDPPPATNWEDR